MARRLGGGARRLAGRLWQPLGRIAIPSASEPSAQWMRQVMDVEIEAKIASLDPATKRAVEISGRTHARHEWREYVALMFPEFDLCAPLGAEHAGRYEVVICEQVLEHVLEPRTAAANLRALCAPGGTAIVSTPFLVRVHELPEYGMRDYWRFTPHGLEALLRDAGFREVAVSSWGNRECVIGNFDRWAASRSWQPHRNEPNLPVQVWAYARNPR
jgi:SAM-dependent methyltransferase